LKFAFSSSFFKESLISTLYGGANNNVHAENIKEQILVIPPTSEQQGIANFLDDKLAQIDEYIAKKQRIIELLKEQKTVIINQAVTKGINPDVPMKYSGVEWLGEIPEHWEVKKIKRFLKSYRYGISDSIRGEGEFKVLTMGNIQDGKVLIPEIGNLESVPEELILEYSDLLFNRTNSLDLVGKVGIFKGSKEDKISFASYLVRLKVNNDTNPVYLNFLLNSYGLLNVARQRALVSLNQVNLNPTIYCQLTIPLPPTSEQQEIVSFIEKKSEKIERSLTVIEKEIKLIQEYRTTLISETVTGKIDVRKYHPPQ
jgi:restriction endonuclease S subunit